MQDTADPRLFHLVHRLHQALFRAGDHMLMQTFGITASQSAVLLFLDSCKRASVSGLASAVGLKITSVSGLIDRMEKKGLVRRRRSDADKRSFHLELTDSGKRLAAQAKPLIRRNNAQLLEKLATGADVEAFADACEILIEVIECHRDTPLHGQPHSSQIANSS